MGACALRVNEKTVSQTAKSWSVKKRLFQCVMEGYWAQAIFSCFYKALEMTGPINEAAVKKVTFFFNSTEN